MAFATGKWNLKLKEVCKVLKAIAILALEISYRGTSPAGGYAS